MSIYSTLFLVITAYYVGYDISRKRERERQRKALEDNLEKSFVDILNKAVPRDRLKRWN